MASTEKTGTIRDLVQQLERIDDGDPFEVPTIFARKPWGPDSDAVILREDTLESESHPGLRCLLAVYIAREVLEVWSAWRDGRSPSHDEAAAAVIHYAEHDAYMPVAGRA
jgi:hypothetical protein